MTIDINKIRNDFPILSTKVHDKPLVYFDNSATTQKPQVVIDSITEIYTTYNSNIHRGIHYLSQVATDKYEAARKTVQKFINAESDSEIIFTRGATESINLVAFSFGETFVNEGDEIIVSEMEHHSNYVPWKMMCERKKAVLKVIHIKPDGTLDMDEYKNLLTERTKLVSVVHVSNSLGTVNPIKEIINLAHANNTAVMIDGAQSIQHIPIDVQELDCDFFAFSGHKIYSPTGVGALYGKEKWLDKMVPYQGGGDMIETVSLENVTYNTLPFKFEAGTMNFGQAIAMAKALDYVSEVGIINIQEHEHNLLKYTTKKLQQIENVTIYGNAPEKSGAISFLFNGVHPADVGMILDKLGIAVRTGTHCTEPVMRYYGIPGTVRISFAMYNTIEEVDVAIKALQRIRNMF